MLKEVYKEQILKVIDFLNNDIKLKEKKIKTLEEENKSYRENFEVLNTSFYNNLNQFKGLVSKQGQLKESFKDTSLVVENKVNELEEEIALKDKEIKSYSSKIKKLKRYNVIIWVLLVVLIIIQMYLYFR